MNSLKHYCIHSIVWDICKRPFYKGIATKNYINKCLELGLPLYLAHFYIKSSSSTAAVHYLENLLGTKLRRWTIREMKNLTYEDEVRYGFCLDVSAMKQN